LPASSEPGGIRTAGIVKEEKRKRKEETGKMKVGLLYRGEVKREVNISNGEGNIGILTRKPD